MGRSFALHGHGAIFCEPAMCMVSGPVVPWQIKQNKQVCKYSDTIQGFPEMWVPSNHLNLNGFFHYNQPYWDPPFMGTP